MVISISYSFEGGQKNIEYTGDVTFVTFVTRYIDLRLWIPNALCRPGSESFRPGNLSLGCRSRSTPLVKRKTSRLASSPPEKDPVMNVYVYDTEGTGVRTRYDRPFQFAACNYDQRGRLRGTINLRGRLPRYVLPDPGALVVTGQSIRQIQNSSLSHYQFIRKVHADITANAPAVVTSYNGIRYDEEILRHSFYSNLLPPYVTQFDGNERVDILSAAQAASALIPKPLNLPDGPDGLPSFKLELLAEANGFTGHDAHDAFGDAHATMHVAQALKARAPRFWRACVKNRDKNHVRWLLCSGDPLVHLGWSHANGKPIAHLIQPVTVDESNPNEWLCVNLDADVDGLLFMDVHSLSGSFESIDGYRKLLRVKTNAFPMVFSVYDAAAFGILLPEESRMGRVVLEEAGFADRLRAAAQQRRDAMEQEDDVWNQLYTGGLFPGRADKVALQRFHQAEAADKWALIDEMEDPRAKHMARWLVGSEWPDALPPEEQRTIEEAFRDHLMQDEAGWTTIPSALRRIDELSPAAEGGPKQILEEYQLYLRDLERSLG